MASKDPKVSKQGTAGKRKHVTLMILEKLKIIRMLETGESCSVVMALYSIGSSTVTYINRRDQLQLRIAWSESEKRLFKQKTLKQPKLLQLGMVLCKWFTAFCSTGKPVIGSVLIGKAKSFHDEIKITDKWCTSPEGWLQIQVLFYNLVHVQSCGCYIKGILQ